MVASRQNVERTLSKALRQQRVKVIKGACRLPNTQAYVERFIQRLQVEGLDHFIIFGTRHFDVLTKVFLQHYHTDRPRQGNGIDNEVLLRARGKPKRVSPENESISLASVRCRKRLGGLLKSYRRAA